MFGSAAAPAAWLEQGFEFSSDTPCGIVQHQNGPCGALAAVNAEVLAHPECDQAVLDQADFIASTTGIIQRAVETPDRPSIVATEDGVFHSIYRQAPDKVLFQAPGMDESCACNQCPFMRLNTMEKLYLALRDLKPQVEVKEDVRVRALVPIERMLELSA